MGRGLGVGGVAIRQLFPIRSQSTAASRSRPRRATASECGSEERGGQKYLQLEGHPNLFGRVPRRPPPSTPTAPAVLAPHAQPLCANPRARCSATIWERLCLLLIVFHLFSAGAAVFCSYPVSAWGSLGLQPPTLQLVI